MDESVKKLLEDKILSLGLGDLYEVQHNRINTPNGGHIIFRGMQDANAHNIKSLEGFDIAWFEEAQAMTGRSLELLRPTIRKPGSELWFSWNPENEGDPVDTFLRGEGLPDGAIVVEANWKHNPWFPEELERERQFDFKYYPNRYLHIWEGDYGREGDPFFLVDSLLIDGKPIVDLPRPDYVFVTMDTASKDGAQHDGTGSILWAQYRHVTPEMPKLIILDWNIAQLTADLLIEGLPNTVQTGIDYANEMNARYGFGGLWIEDKDSGIALIQKGQRIGLDVEAIDTRLTSLGKEGRALSVSDYIAQGDVKISQKAFDKTVLYRDLRKNHLLDQLNKFRIGMPRKEHMLDLVDCFSYGVSIALGDSSGW